MIQNTSPSDQSTKSPNSQDNYLVGSPEILKQQVQPRNLDYNYFHNSSQNNLSYTQLNVLPFDIEEPLHNHHSHHQNNLPLYSPQMHQYDYHPQNLLSKHREQQEVKNQQQWACNWQNQSNNNHNNEQIMVSSQQQQNQPLRDAMWDGSFMEGGMHSQFNSFAHEENMIGNNSNILNTSQNSGVNNSNNNSFLANTPRLDRNERSRATSNIENHNQILHSEFIGEFNGINQNYNVIGNLNGMDIETRIDKQDGNHNDEEEPNEAYKSINPMVYQTSKIVMNYNAYHEKTKLHKTPNILRGYEDQDTEESQSNLLPEQTTTTHSTLDNKPPSCFCNCKKTKCLKLYCECFAKLGFCGQGCHCQGCYNKKGKHQAERMQAIEDAKLRNPDAFQSKASLSMISGVSTFGGDKSSGSKRGCNCRKTKCLKKYCECYNSGEYCGISCRCEGCLNKPGISKENNDNPHRRTDNTSSLAIVQNYDQMQRRVNVFCTEKVPQIVQKYESQNVVNSRRNMCLQEFEEPYQEEISSSMISSASSQSMQRKRQHVVIGGKTNVRICKQSKQSQQYIFSTKKQSSDEENNSNNNQSNGSFYEISVESAKKTDTNNQEKDLNSAEKEEENDYLESSDEKQQYLEDLEKKLLQIQQVEQLLQQQQQLQENIDYIQDSNSKMENTEIGEEKTSEKLEWISKKEQIQHQITEDNNNLKNSDRKTNNSEARKKKKKYLIEKQHQKQQQYEQQLFSASKSTDTQSSSSLRLLNCIDSQAAAPVAGEARPSISSSGNLQQPEQVNQNGILRTGLGGQNMILTANKPASNLQRNSNIFNGKLYSQYPQASANLFEPTTYSRPQKHSTIIFH